MNTDPFVELEQTLGDLLPGEFDGALVEWVGRRRDFSRVLKRALQHIDFKLDKYGVYLGIKSHLDDKPMWVRRVLDYYSPLDKIQQMQLLPEVFLDLSKKIWLIATGDESFIPKGIAVEITDRDWEDTRYEIKLGFVRDSGLGSQGGDFQYGFVNLRIGSQWARFFVHPGDRKLEDAYKALKKYLDLLNSHPELVNPLALSFVKALTDRSLVTLGVLEEYPYYSNILRDNRAALKA